MLNDMNGLGNEVDLTHSLVKKVILVDMISTLLFSYRRARVDCVIRCGFQLRTCLTFIMIKQTKSAV